MKPPSARLRRHSFDAEQLLREAGLKATSPRIALLRALHAAARPLSAAALHASVGGDADVVTLYRNLEAFAAQGLARRIEGREGHALYECVDDTHTHHHHVTCTVCGRMEDVELCVPPRVLEEVSKKACFAEIQDHVIELYGICAACQASRTKIRP